ncbi:hypothetical protein BZA77DRAFT_390115 [Pyronema omphalodes]|nr:hypothetical protein BZA77DRAFT_390115 [Pyronema omphalodes]
MEQLDGAIQLAEIRFGMKGDARDGGISSEDARLLAAFCGILRNSVKKAEKKPKAEFMKRIKALEQRIDELDQEIHLEKLRLDLQEEHKYFAINVP